MQQITVQYLESLVGKWREVLGVDPIYTIFVELVTKSDESFEEGDLAVIEGLEQDNTHPSVTIKFSASFMEEAKKNEEIILDTVIHELLHIPIWEALVMSNPKYKYKKMMGRASEILDEKMTKAILFALKEKANKK